MGSQRVRRTLCWLAAAGALLAVIGEMAGRLGWRDPDLVRLVQQIGAGLNVGVLVALALGAAGLALATRAAWWIAASTALALRTVMACVELLVLDPAAPPAPGLMALAGVTVVGAWGCLGLAILARRRDGAPGLGLAAGVVVGLMALAFSGLYLGFAPDGQVSDAQVAVLDLGQALALVGMILLAAFLVSAADGPRGSAVLRAHKAARRVAIFGALSLGTALGIILYAAPVGWMASEASALVGLALGCAGLVAFGLAPVVLRPGPMGWLATGLGWAAAVCIPLVVVFGRSYALAWAAAVVSSLAMFAAGAVLLAVRGPGARPAVAAGGSLVISSAVGMTWAALGLSDTSFDLRETIRVLTTMGFLVAFSLAAVALLTGAGRPWADAPPSDAEGGEA